MNYRQIGIGLGVFPVALGSVKLFASHRIARALEAEGRRASSGALAREVLAGIGLLSAPAVSASVWSRVSGDVMDAGALALAARAHPRNKSVWGSIAFVLAGLALDVLAARGLDRQTGRFLPLSQPAG